MASERAGLFRGSVVEEDDLGREVVLGRRRDGYQDRGTCQRGNGPIPARMCLRWNEPNAKLAGPDAIDVKIGWMDTIVFAQMNIHHTRGIPPELDPDLQVAGCEDR